MAYEYQTFSFSYMFIVGVCLVPHTLAAHGIAECDALM